MKLEPIVGRYAQLELEGRAHRLYFEEAGQGVPLLCLHTAGSDGRQFRAVLLSLVVRQRMRFFVAVARRPDLETIRELVESGAVRPAVDRTYPLVEAAQAVRDMAEGRVRGKAVVTV